MRATQTGAEKLRCTISRCMPTECPAQRVMMVVTRNNAIASQLAVIGAKTRAMPVIVDIQRDLAGDQANRPATALLFSSAIIRKVEKQVIARLPDLPGPCRPLADRTVGACNCSVNSLISEYPNYQYAIP